MNVIFILLDDLGWNDVGINNSQIYTPNINNLTYDGCRLLRNYTFPVCGPTRAMIQSGVYAYKCGMQRLFDPWEDYGLDRKLKIIPEYLKEMGYSTYAIGKWHLGHNDKKFLPHNRGYDYYYGNVTGCVHHYDHHSGNGGTLPEAQIHDFMENGKPKYHKGHFCDLFTNKCLDIIEENKNNKFFIYLAYNSPHVPLECPQNFKDFYSINDPKKSYYGMIMHLDFNLGRIFEKLKKLELYDDTLIWLQSDNGGWLISWAGGDNYPLQNGKTSFYEGGVRVFSVLKTNKLKSKESDVFIHSTDVLPTILDFCGYDKNINVDGMSKMNNLINNTKNTKEIVLGFYNEFFWCFLFDNIKIISEGNLGIKCFDLIKDPLEKNNIIDYYENNKNRIENKIKECLSFRVHEPKDTYTRESAKIKCKNLKFWGQQNKKILLNNKVIEESPKRNFLELSGYNIFYK